MPEFPSPSMIAAACWVTDAGLAGEIDLDLDAVLRLGSARLDDVPTDLGLNRVCDTWCLAAESLGIVQVASWRLLRWVMRETELRRVNAEVPGMTVADALMAATTIVSTMAVAVAVDTDGSLDELI